MPITNNLKKQIDQPVWEWMRFALTTFNGAAANFATAIDGSDRYIYYQYPGVFQRYDTWSDTWASLSPPAYYATATIASTAYSKSQGNRGRVLSGGTSTITIPSLISAEKLVGHKIRITAGPGAEQTRTIASATNPVTFESGVQTGGTATTLIDSTKRWRINQWVGHTCRITFGTNATFQRTVIYNTVDTLYFNDGNYIPYEPWDNQGFLTAFSTGTYSTYELASQTVTFDTPLTTGATTDSRFLIQSGVIWVLSSQAGSPYLTFQMYDVLTDVWYQKTMPSGLFASGLSTEIAITPIDEVEAAYISSTATAATNRRLTDSTLSLTNDQYRNYQIRLTGGTGAGQRRRITSNINNTFEVDSKWSVTPDATTTYEIWPNTDFIYFTGNAQSATFAYDVEADLWVTAPNSDSAVSCNATVTKNGDLPLGILSAADNGTGSVLTVAVNAAGSNYAVGDVIQISGGGANCRLYVTSTTTAGGVTGVSFKNSGSAYATSTGTATTTVSGSGSGCTINVTSIGRTGSVTTTIAHFLKVGDSITIAGSSVAGWNGTYTVLAADNVNNFNIASTATASLTATSSTGTSLIVDPTKNWDTNEHLGKFLIIVAGGTVAPAMQIRRIASNTATTITPVLAFSSFTPTSGTTRYCIVDPSTFGRDNKFWADSQLGYGYPTSGTTTSITDTTKNWVRGTWVGHVVRITAGTGLGNELTITANNNNTITFGAAAFTPDTTTRYTIMDTFGTATSGSTTTLVDTAKNWIPNQWVNKRLRFIGGAAVTNEVTITGNTSNTLTFAATTATDSSTNYVIYGIPAYGIGAAMKWMWGNGNHRYLFTARGSATSHVNMFDITTGKYDFAISISGQTESFSTGSMWAYDGGDRIYVQKDQTGRIFYFDMAKREIVNSGTVPYGMSTAIAGNRMEIIKTEDGLKYLYVARHTGIEMWRTLIFW
jgi:hypothetical protein